MRFWLWVSKHLYILLIYLQFLKYNYLIYFPFKYHIETLLVFWRFVYNDVVPDISVMLCDCNDVSPKIHFTFKLEHNNKFNSINTTLTNNKQFHTNICTQEIHYNYLQDRKGLLSSSWTRTGGYWVSNKKNGPLLHTRIRRI